MTGRNGRPALVTFSGTREPPFSVNPPSAVVPGFAFFLHIICNKREVGIAFLGNGNLLVTVRGLFRLGGSDVFEKPGAGGTSVHGSNRYRGP